MNTSKRVAPLQWPQTLYHPSFEHDACGTGFVANIDGQKSHAIVQMAVQAVINLTHRGAIGSDAKTGDGAGITAQLPYALMEKALVEAGRTPPSHEDMALGMVFLPQDTDAAAQSVRIIEDCLRHYGLEPLCWRAVPIDKSALGGIAEETCPDVRQIIVARDKVSLPDFERVLYLARKAMEQRAASADLSDLYFPSFSSRTVVYKGMLVAPQLPQFYLDLADPEFTSGLALFHQRYSTNTFPNWYLAQPFRFLAHNGEINTLQGNVNWMRAREPEMKDTIWGDDIEALKPIITPGGSDSAMLDNVLDFLVASGRDIRHVMMMLVPEPWENMPNMDPALRAFYQYHACLMEPWDGPAALSFTDGAIVGATLDRNGLRPARYVITEDGVIAMASEVGVLPLDDHNIRAKGRLGPGQMIAVDTRTGMVQHDKEVKAFFANQHPYGEWLRSSVVPFDEYLSGRNGHLVLNEEGDLALQRAFGFTFEEMQLVLRPMTLEKKEPVGSMGNDTPPSVLSAKPHVLSTYFKQKFAQVTNPPIDSLREELVMSSFSLVGSRGSITEEASQHARLIQLSTPILYDNELDALRLHPLPEFASETISVLWRVAEGAKGMVLALRAVCQAASTAVDQGKSIIILSDRGVNDDHAAIPILLAVGAVHHHLIREGKRMRASIVAETGAAWEVHHFATLVGYGASAVNPYLIHQVIQGMIDEGEGGSLDLEHALSNYRGYATKGLLKIMSKMGISTVSSYQGAQIFEAIGLNSKVIDECFTGTPSAIQGIGYDELAEDVLRRHQLAFPPLPPKMRPKLDDLGYYRFRKDGEYHAYNPELVRVLHKAILTDEKEDFRKYTDLVETNEAATHLRSLLEFKPGQPIPIDEVEPVAAITKRFVTGAMSLGALGPEAHRTVAEGMNLIGGKSDTGEGGEESWRFRDINGRSYNSAIKQVASGRFGVTPDYLASAHELEIKMAQGSKPGEGGQLPGHKVMDHIAAIRYTQPGVGLISPPPHHDIYSIEDLAQLIYDLKVVNPQARVSVKLVSEAGVGTIAAGVAKGYADAVHISGDSGGTGASPLSSIKNAGTPWELGLAETQQVLVQNNLRGRVTLRTDGGFRTGRDVLIAAMLGAEEYGFGTIALVALGCQMARQCHLNTCPVGIATQRADLRSKFTGTAEEIVRFFTHIAEEVRELLAELGYRSLNEVIGQTELLMQSTPTNNTRAMGLDLSPLLVNADPTGKLPRRRMQERNDRGDTPMDDQIMQDAAPAIEGREHVQLEYPITNANRTVGARVSGAIARLYTDKGLPENSSLRITFTGSAGQSFGAFGITGLYFKLIGEANDYVGKGLHGGEIVVRPGPTASFAAADNVIIGNTVLYGATGGSLYAAGRAGERFCVRNSGASAVVEGVGDHCCEYMTGGVTVVLGETGRNFGAGMSGGVAFVLDEEGQFPSRYNPELVGLERVTRPEEQRGLRTLIERHLERTDSVKAARVLQDWDRYLELFWKVVPHSSEATHSVAHDLTEDGELPQRVLSVTIPETVLAR